MPHTNAIEALLSAQRIDIDNQEQLAASCEVHAIAEDALRAVIDTLRPWSVSLAVFVTR